MNKKAFTLLELVLTMIILSIGLVSLLAVLKYASINSSENQVNTVSTWLCQDMFEQALTIRHDSGFSAVPILTNYTDSPVSGYTRATKVGYVEISDLNTVVTGPTDYKRIEVSVSNDGSPGAVTMYALVSDY